MLIGAECKYVQKIMKHICSDRFPNGSRVSTQAYPYRLWCLFCGLHFREEYVNYLHESVDNFSGGPVHYGKAEDEHLCAI